MADAWPSIALFVSAFVSAAHSSPRTLSAAPLSRSIPDSPVSPFPGWAAASLPGWWSVSGEWFEASFACAPAAFCACDAVLRVLRRFWGILPLVLLLVCRFSCFLVSSFVVNVSSSTSAIVPPFPATLRGRTAAKRDPQTAAHCSRRERMVKQPPGDTGPHPIPRRSKPAKMAM